MRLDANEDGKLTADELPEPLLRIMEQLDVNEDGAVDGDELRAMSERMRARRLEGERSGRPSRARPRRPESDDA
jgi:hypothetical protein